MTEDGRSSGVPGPSQFQAGGHPDAQLDAFTDSLWLDTAAGFVLPANKSHMSRPGCWELGCGASSLFLNHTTCIPEGETL